jgi:hypothetical protein
MLSGVNHLPHSRIKEWKWRLSGDADNPTKGAVTRVLEKNKLGSPGLPGPNVTVPTRPQA